MRLTSERRMCVCKYSKTGINNLIRYARTNLAILWNLPKSIFAWLLTTRNSLISLALTWSLAMGLWRVRTSNRQIFCIAFEALEGHSPRSSAFCFSLVVHSPRRRHSPTWTSLAWNNRSKAHPSSCPNRSTEEGIGKSSSMSNFPISVIWGEKCQ